MPLVLAALLAIAPVSSTGVPAAAAALPSCSWNRPGQNPFMGDVVAAVDHYTDIPAPVRGRLKARMAARSYDEMVSIRRDAIVGKAHYGAAITGMHFGAGQVCGTVNRAQWSRDAQERGLVYCESGHCILVPTVCRNVSRITRQAVASGDTAAPNSATAMAGDAGGGGGSGGGALGSGATGVAPGADAGAPAAASGATPETRFSQATSPGASASDAAGGSSGLGSAASAAAAPAHTGSWAAAAGGTSATGFAVGIDTAWLPLRQLSTLPSNGQGPVTDGGTPASPVPGSTGGWVTGPALPVTVPISGLLTGNDVVPSPVPEPGSALLLLAGLGWLARRAVHHSAGH